LLVWRDFDPYGFKPQFQPYLSTFGIGSTG
jgi:hypothetical protein